MHLRRAGREGLLKDAEHLRQIILHRRDLIPVADRRSRSDAIWKRLVELPAFQGASQALFYLSFKSEVETEMMRRLTRDLGMTVAAPRSMRGSFDMRFFVLPPEEPLASGPYGVLQPAEGLPLADLKLRSVVLVPGSVFDRRGQRLGWGGGYYDRWLSGEGKGLASVGLAFSEQVVEEVPAQVHDLPVDFLVTDTETVDCRKVRGQGI